MGGFLCTGAIKMRLLEGRTNRRDPDDEQMPSACLEVFQKSVARVLPRDAGMEHLAATVDPFPKVYLVEPLAPLRQNRKAERHGQALQDEPGRAGTENRAPDLGVAAPALQREFLPDRDKMADRTPSSCSAMGRSIQNLTSFVVSRVTL